MQYCYMDEADRLVAVIERMGNGRPASPVRWALRWSLGQQASGLRDSIHSDRLEAQAAVLSRCPHARTQVFNRRGERVR